ncbi:hypothetical protein K0M31_008669 [Melipona bicolor]|uniref:Uncharacterized protein n=1 Tax=Melipona bicolor TaxID=60889 RepID=A0AA40FPM3_9HYME|nr:hypothetical protein K0M31_008669 [Melipona bicolor]
MIFCSTSHDNLHDFVGSSSIFLNSSPCAAEEGFSKLQRQVTTFHSVPFDCCSFPLKRLFSHEPQEHHAYSRAHKAGHEGHDCATMFAGCSFSLIDMALGKYDARRPQLPPEYADTAESFDDWTRYNMK